MQNMMQEALVVIMSVDAKHEMAFAFVDTDDDGIDDSIIVAKDNDSDDIADESRFDACDSCVDVDGDGEFDYVDFDNDSIADDVIRDDCYDLEEDPFDTADDGKEVYGHLIVMPMVLLVLMKELMVGAIIVLQVLVLQ